MLIKKTHTLKKQNLWEVSSTAPEAPFSSTPSFICKRSSFSTKVLYILICTLSDSWWFYDTNISYLANGVEKHQQLAQRQHITAPLLFWKGGGQHRMVVGPDVLGQPIGSIGSITMVTNYQPMSHNISQEKRPQPQDGSLKPAITVPFLKNPDWEPVWISWGMDRDHTLGGSLCQWGRHMVCSLAVTPHFEENSQDKSSEK